MGKVGNAFAADRGALIGRLEATATAGPFQWEMNRRARIVDELDRTRRIMAERRVRIAVAPAINRPTGIVCALSESRANRPTDLAFVIQPRACVSRWCFSA
jgi:hypothetical protein